MNIRIENGWVVDPVNGINEIRTLHITDQHLSESASTAPDRIINATGLHVLPGLIDAHCHLRDPGYEYKEDIISGSKSASTGGFTSVMCMPNTNPICDNAAVVRYIREKAERQGFARVFPIGALSKGQKGLELAEVGLMAEQGIVAISDDGQPVDSSDLMRKAIQYASAFNIRVISHCEDRSMAEGGHMNEGYTSTRLGLRGIPTAAEDIQIAREIILAEYLQLPVHLAHVSTASGVTLIRDAKARGVQVTCETCPHYFTLTEEACLGYNTLAKMNPPLRTPSDIEAIIAGLADGTIDMIVTDHAPHHDDEKEIEFALASNGIIGFETAFALSYTALVRPGHITLSRLVELMSVKPAQVFLPQFGTLSAGSPADVTIVDLAETFTVDRYRMASKAHNSPWHGQVLHGIVKGTITGGKIIHDELR
jgi:dihydroorotase